MSVCWRFNDLTVLLNDTDIECVGVSAEGFVVDVALWYSGCRGVYEISLGIVYNDGDAR